MTQYLQIMDLGAGPNKSSLAERTKMLSVESSRIEMKRTEAVISSWPQSWNVSMVDVKVK